MGILSLDKLTRKEWDLVMAIAWRDILIRDEIIIELRKGHDGFTAQEIEVIVNKLNTAKHTDPLRMV